MDLLRKADNLSEAFDLLDPTRPLEGKRLDRFYAQRTAEASIEPLVDEFLLVSRDDHKALFTGHRGSGKTTELARLEEKLAPTHTVVRFNAEGLLNLGDVDYADLLVVLGLQVFQRAQESGAELDEGRQRDLLFWYSERIIEEADRGPWKSELGGELSAVFAKFTAKLTTDAPYRRETVRARAQAHLSDLLERLNHLLDDLREKTGRPTMVIVDGLAKMHNQNQVSDLFCQGANALLAPRCRVVYTVPLALYHTNDFHHVRMSFPGTFALPNIKPREQDGAPCPEGRAALQEVLNCRLVPGLLAPEAVALLIEQSGGLLKELIALAREAALRARRLRGEEGPVEADDVEYAARQLRNTYRASLTQDQFAELWRIYSGGRFVNSEIARSLLHNLSLLGYDGGEAWWAVHPVVQPLLEERRDEFEPAG